MKHQADLTPEEICAHNLRRLRAAGLTGKEAQRFLRILSWGAQNEADGAFYRETRCRLAAAAHESESRPSMNAAPACYRGSKVGPGPNCYGAMFGRRANR